MPNFKQRIVESFTLKRLFYLLGVTVVAIGLGVLTYLLNSNKVLVNKSKYSHSRVISDTLTVLGSILILGALLGIIFNSKFFANAFFKFKNRKEDARIRGLLDEARLKKQTEVRKLKVKTLERQLNDQTQARLTQTRLSNFPYYLTILVGLIFVCIGIPFALT
ncbi:hypothetical protein [Mycoplasmopsis columbinasalis]|uniref:DUF3899 domain-containing protein n=1 Tax=Mycoplasmopsis columbinasalis TaxID=114880 RepID=A0A449B9F5_9BACT|nr:hypothetical protein [Mycoplasmopsis columbinasalis]VEU77811.1 Uncharacterised protein [Mycoplasmopsis columbinasalis]